MSRAHSIECHIDREEDRLLKMYNDNIISQSEYNEEMRALQQEARDAYQADLDEAHERVRNEWGW